MSKKIKKKDLIVQLLQEKLELQQQLESELRQEQLTSKTYMGMYNAIREDLKKAPQLKDFNVLNEGSSVPFHQYDEAIMAERARQIYKGYTFEHDLEHGIGHLVDELIQRLQQGKFLQAAALAQAIHEVYISLNEDVKEEDPSIAESPRQFAIVDMEDVYGDRVKFRPIGMYGPYESIAAAIKANNSENFHNPENNIISRLYSPSYIESKTKDLKS